MKKLAFASLSLSVLALVVQPAAAQQPAPTPATPSEDANVCADSYEHAQEYMRPNQAETKLLKAREALRTCLRSNCKSWIVSDCSKWLSEVETRIPTIVLAAKDASGQDLTDVHVTTKAGSPLADKLEGSAIELEPGQHDFVFIREDGTRMDKHALVREGDKAQAIIVTFPPRPGDVPPPRADGPQPEPEPPTRRYVGYGLAGVGVVGIGVGAVLGLITLSKKSSDCDTTGCTPGTRDSLSSTAAASTMAFVAGAALTAGGVALVLLSPAKKVGRGHVEARVGLGTLTLGGTF